MAFSRSVTLNNGGDGFADSEPVVIDREVIAGLSAQWPNGWNLGGTFCVHQVQMEADAGTFTVRVWARDGAWAPYAQGAKSSWSAGELLRIDDIVTEALELTPADTDDAAIFHLESFRR